MKFKERKPNPRISHIRYILKPIMPEPEVGKIYHSFDDGKRSLSRLIDWKITKRIDLDHDKVSKNLLKVLQRDIKKIYWLFDTEQTVIYRAYPLDENGKYNKQIKYCYFIRTKKGGWYGAGGYFYWRCELDVDNRWYNELIKEKNNG